VFGIERRDVDAVGTRYGVRRSRGVDALACEYVNTGYINIRYIFGI
jgi:hypothetical protein